MSKYIAATDQGTTSTRCMVFDHDGRVVSAEQREHRQYFPRAGWVEHDPLEIWANTKDIAAGALACPSGKTSVNRARLRVSRPGAGFSDLGKPRHAACGSATDAIVGGVHRA